MSTTDTAALSPAWLPSVASPAVPAFTAHDEIRMASLSYSIRSKPDWPRKLEDPAIRARWRAEALAESWGYIEGLVASGVLEAGEPAVDSRRRDWMTLSDEGIRADVKFARLSEAMVDYVLEELEVYKQELKQASGIRASCCDRVFESDTLISSELRDRLILGVSKLEDVTEDAKDWHPGSKVVLDLVHPSLYPIRYGATLFRPKLLSGELSSNLEVVEAPPETGGLVSSKFAWLPTDFAVSGSGRATPLSYINNLHPALHQDLYPVLSEILSAFLPMFTRVLSRPLARRIQVAEGAAYSWYGEATAEDLSDEEDEEVANAKREAFPPISIPQPAPYNVATSGRVRKEEDLVSFNGRTVQVIVKIASIHLNPKNPRYKGGAWHLEGMQAESIVVSGIYYYSSENVTSSHLALRCAIDPEHDEWEYQFEQGDNRGVRLVYGLENELPAIQSLGSVATIEGRAIAWPNNLQHRVSPFVLADPALPGHRKILAFFLVNPISPTLSTTQVSPQQLEWAVHELDAAKSLMAEGVNSAPPALPAELWDVIQGMMSPEVIDIVEAKRVREELMAERQEVVMNLDSESSAFSYTLNLCEH